MILGRKAWFPLVWARTVAGHQFLTPPSHSQTMAKMSSYACVMEGVAPAGSALKLGNKEIKLYVAS